MSTEIATTDTRKSLLVTMAEKYAMDPEVFKNVVKTTVMPAKATNEQMAAFLLVAHQYDLNPITKEIYAFPARGGGIQPIVGVDGWINLAQRRPEFDGMDFEHGDDYVTCRIYRKDRSHPIVVTEFMDECARPTEPWKSHPRRMLRHKAVIQAIRYAFGFSGIKDEDEAEAAAPPAKVIDLNAELEVEVLGYPEIMQSIQRAKDKAELLEANKAALAFQGPDEQKRELAEAVTKVAEDMGVKDLQAF